MDIVDFLSQDDNVKTYVPLIAALATLVGVAFTLIVTELRNARRSRVDREDSYRAEVRKAIGELLVNAEEFRRHGWVLSRPEYWATIGFEQATNIANLTESNLRATVTSLINAQLLVHDQSLIDELAAVRQSLNRASEVVHDMVESFWESRTAHLAHERETRWEDLTQRLDSLREQSRLTLHPTVRKVI